MKITLSTEGQIILPAEIRRQDGIEPGQDFEIERIAPGEYRLVRLAPPRNQGFVDWLQACPEKDFFVPLNPSRLSRTVEEDYMPPGPRIAVLLHLIDQAYDRKSWHGTNLRGSLRGLSAEQAAWRPAADRHNIWELAVHAAYWKYSVLRRLLGGEGGGFPVKGSNWFRRPEPGPDEKAWKEDLALLARVHRELRDAVAGLSDEALDQIPPGSKTRLDDLISGVAFHDIYHAGQIQLLKRLHREGSSL